MKIKFTMVLATLMAASSVTFGNTCGSEGGRPWDGYLQQAESEKYSGSSSTVLLDSTCVSVEATGQGAFTISRVIRINSRAGAIENRILKYDYDPLTAAAEFKWVRVHRKDGSVTVFDPSKTLDYAAPASMIYWGARQIMLELGELQPGDIIEYEIDKKGFTYALLGAEDDPSRFIPPMRGQFYDIVPFWSSVPTVHKVYKVSIPGDRDMQYQFYQGSCASSLRFQDGRKVYTFSMDGLMPFKSEDHMVELFDVAPKLMMSTTMDWKEKSRWFNRVNEDYGSFNPIPEARKKVDELIKGKDGEMEKIEVLTHWVADNIRYAGISMGKGEGYTLHNLKMNYTDRCGVCKDIAGTLVAFLRMAGFEAYPAMTMVGSRVESIPADHFNHCVAVVRLSDGTLLPLDPTWVPFSRELWSSLEQQQNYLPGTPEGSDLCKTPISPAERHYIRITASNTLQDNGTLKGTLTVKAEGQSDRALRGVFTGGFQTEWETYMEKQILAVSPRAKVTRAVYSKDPRNYMRAPMEMSFSYEIPGYAMTGDGVRILKPFVMNGLFSRVMSFLSIDTDLEKREHGFADRCSRLVELDETLLLPSGYHMEGEPLKDEISGSAAAFNGSLTQQGNAVRLKSTLELKKRVYEAADWNNFREAVSAYKKYGDDLIIGK